MHEFSIAETIVEIAVDEMGKRPPARLTAARVVIGQLHQIVPDNLIFAFDVLAEKSAVRGARLMIREVPVTVACRICRWSGGIDFPVFRCGQCGCGDVEVTQGRELYLESLEVEDDGQH